MALVGNARGGLHFLFASATAKMSPSKQHLPRKAFGQQRLKFSVPQLASDGNKLFPSLLLSLLRQCVATYQVNCG